MHVTDAVRIVAHELNVTKQEAANWLLVKRAPQKLARGLSISSGEFLLQIGDESESVELARDVLIDIADGTNTSARTVGDSEDCRPAVDYFWWDEKEFMDFLAEELSPAPPTFDLLKWPWGNYSTKTLELMAAAATRFWVAYQPENPRSAPKTNEVTDWLIENGVSKNIASAIATILRADKLATGNRKSGLNQKT